MNKAQVLLEKVKDVSSETDPGKYTTRFEVTKDLSDEVARHAHSDDDEFASDILDDVIRYYHKLLNTQVWDEIRHNPGVTGMNLEVEYKGDHDKHMAAKTIDDVMAILKNCTFDISVEVITRLDTKTQVDVDNGIKKILDQK